MTPTPEERGALLRLRLGDAARSWVTSIEYHDTLDSTNDRLKQRARDGVSEGAVTLADRQTAGRGRWGNTWESPAGNLFLSLLLRPQVSPDRLGLLPLAAGIAVVDAVADLGVHARLKWPNDVLVGERKLGGILAEAASSAGGIESVVLGVGLNVGLSPESVPPELRSRITSLRDEAVGADVGAVAVHVLDRLTHWCAAWAAGSRDVVREWKARSVGWWDRPVEVRSAGRIVAGVVRDIDPTGAIVLETAGGKLLTIVSGEARQMRRPEA